MFIYLYIDKCTRISALRSVSWGKQRADKEASGSVLLLLLPSVSGLSFPPHSYIFLFVHSLAPSTVLPPVFVIQRLPASQRLGQTVSVKKNDIPGVPPLFHFLLGSHVPLL